MIRKKKTLAKKSTVKTTAKTTVKSFTTKSVSQNSKMMVVGIGASAGGLQALKDLLSLLPNDTGMAFVIIQHLDPKHKSMSPEILARSTKMSVVEITQGMKLLPNQVHVIPSNHHLSISQGKFQLLPRTGTRNLYLPLDHFFESLAEELTSRAIAVVLSGTASDGTKGLQAIKAEGGITIAQDPKSAQYDGMPKSAIASGFVDLILKPKDIAFELARIAQHPSTKINENLNQIFNLLLSGTNTDFSQYKTATIQRRISKRMTALKINDLAKFTKYLKDHPEEVKSLCANLLIHVTSFFRDPKSFEALKNKILPKYLKNRDSKLPFRIWVPGCSTGEEAYSLAMIFMELLDESETRNPLSIFGTDISENALKKARKAVYPESIDKEVTPKRLKRFFEKVEGGYRIAKWLRETCLFSRHDVTRDPPFAKVDLISCRNLLIYFDSDLQKRVIPIFHYALNPGGLLFLGKSEGNSGFANLFSVYDKTYKVFTKKNITSSIKFHFPKNPISIEPIHKTAKFDLQKETDRIALSQYVPPSVVVNDQFEIVQTHGSTAPFLELSTGHPSLNLFKMAKQELITDLRVALYEARKNNAPIIKESIHHTIRVVPVPLSSQNKEQFFTIFFEKGKDKQKITHSRMKKKSANEEYQQSLIEQFETAQEELVASNEELQSTNEELQSTNEELETAKEELQSTNEEITTVNDELQVRNSEISQLNDDLMNLFSSADIAIVMIGTDGKIRRFTPRAAKTFNLNPDDAGKPIGTIKNYIESVDLEKLVNEVLNTYTLKEVEVQDRNGVWYNLVIRPFRTTENKIEGAVLSLPDINKIKKNAEEIKRAAEDAETIIQAQPIPLLVLDANLNVKISNVAFCNRFELSRTITEGKNISEIGEGKFNIQELLKELRDTLTLNTPFSNFILKQDFPKIGSKILSLSASKVRLAGSSEFATLLAIDDVTDRLKTEEDLKNSEEKYRSLITTAKDGILIVNQEGIIEFSNLQVEKMFGYSSQELQNLTIETLIPDSLKQAHIQQRAQYAIHPVSREMGSKLEIFAKHKDGKNFPVDVSLNPIKTQKGLYITATIRDISDLKAVEKERADILIREKQARAAAEKANLIKDEFLATLSHELRTPLTNILSWAQMLNSGKLDAEKTKHGIEVIERSALAQSQLIDDLLDISRIQAGKLSLSIEYACPRTIISEAVDSIKNFASTKSIQIETSVDPKIRLIAADPLRLQQILWNLITNAIKFSPPHSKITVSVDQIILPSGDKIRFQIRDYGKGIKSEFLPIIFDQFTQVDSSSTRAYGGLGLGLTIVRKLVEMHHGTISAESLGEGKGTTFTILFPDKINLGSDTQNTKVKSDEIIIINETLLRGIKVLLVEDEIDASEAFALMLQSYGAETKTANTAKIGLEFLENFKPDVLVSDIAMPVEDGYSLIKKIRSMKSELGKTPAIALTAYASELDIQNTVKAGFQSHLSKPIDSIKLAQAIAKLVGRK